MTRTRTRPEPIANPIPCWCPGGRPTLYATWRDEQLASVTRRHLTVCGQPAEVLDPREFERSVTR